MEDADHCDLFGELFDGCKDIHLVADVQVRSRLIEQKVAGLLGERPGDDGALKLAATDSGDRAGGKVRDPGKFHGPAADAVILRGLF